MFCIQRSRFLKSLIVASALVLLVDCSSSNDSKSGIVTGFDRQPVAGNTVRLVNIDDKGEELAVIDSTTTNSDGRFRFDLEKNTNATTLVTTVVGNVSLRAFYAGGNFDTSLNPITEGTVSLVTDITKTSDAASLVDFSAEELRDINDLQDALQTGSLDLTDATATKEFLRLELGRAIAERSTGAVSAITLASFDAAEPTAPAAFAQNLGICPLGPTIHVLNSDTFRFDIEEDGSLCGGTHPTISSIFDEGAFSLVATSREFFTYGGDNFPTAALGSYTLEDGKEFSFGPYPLKQISMNAADDISLQRKVYVSPTGNWVRYLDSVINASGTDQSLAIQIQSTLTTDSSSKLLTHDLEGQTPSTQDRYVSVYDTITDKPSATFLFQDAHGQNPTTLFVPEIAGGAQDEVSQFWNVTVPAGQTKSVLHYGFLHISKLAADIRRSLEAFLESPDMTGLTAAEINAIVNFSPSRGTIVGTAGAVIGRASVTGTNGRTSQSLVTVARDDGSFALALDTQSGDVIALTASDGLSTNVTVP